jgi:hypothetical protein
MPLFPGLNSIKPHVESQRDSAIAYLINPLLGQAEILGCGLKKTNKTTIQWGGVLGIKKRRTGKPF